MQGWAKGLVQKAKDVTDIAARQAQVAFTPPDETGADGTTLQKPEDSAAAEGAGRKRVEDATREELIQLLKRQTGKLKVVEEEFGKLKQKYIGTFSEYEEVKQSHDSLAHELTLTKDALSSFQGGGEEHVAQLHHLLEQKAKADESVATLTERYAKLEDAYQSLEAGSNSHALEETQQALQEKERQHRELVEKMKVLVTKYKEQQAKLNERKEPDETGGGDFGGTISVLQQELRAVTVERDQALSKLSAREEQWERSAANEEADAVLQAKVAELQEALDVKNEQHDKLLGKMKQLMAHCKTLQQNQAKNGEEASNGDSPLAAENAELARELATLQEENQVLQDKYRESEAHIQVLSDERDNFHTQMVEAEGRLNDMQRRAGEVGAHFKDMEGNWKALSQEKDALALRMAAAEEKLAESDAMRQQLLGDKEEVTKKLLVADSRVLALSEEHGVLIKQVQERDSTIVALKEGLQRAESARSLQEAEAAEAHELVMREVRVLRDKDLELQAKVQALSAEKETLNEIRDGLQAALAGKEGALEEQRERAAHLEVELRGTVEHIEALHEQVEHAKQQSTSLKVQNGEVVKGLQSQLDAARVKISETEKSFSQVAKKLQDAEARVAELAQGNEMAASMQRLLEHTKTEAEEKERDLRGQLEVMEDRLERAISDGKTRVKAMRDALSNELEAAKYQLDQEILARKGIVAELRNTTQEHEGLTARLGALEEENRSCKIERDKLLVQLGDAEQLVSSAQQQLRQEAAARNELTQKLNTASERLEESLEEREELMRRGEELTSTVQALEGAVQIAKEAQEQSERQIRELEGQLKQVTAQSAETELQWRDACERSDGLIAELQRLLSDRDKLAEQLKVTENQTKALAAESDQATALQVMLEKVQNDARSRIEALTTERDGLMKSVEEQKSAVTALRSGMEQERNDHQSRLAALAQERDELARKAGQDGQALSGDKDALKAQVDDAEKRVAELRRRLEQSATKAAETESQWRAVCEHSDVLAADLEQAKGRIGAMEEEIERSSALHQRLLNDRDKLAEQLKVAENQMKALAEESDQATALQAMLEKVQNDARSRIEALTAERVGLMKSVEEQKSAVMALRSGMEQERSDLQSRLRALAQERDELARKAGQDVQALSGDKDALKAQVDNAEKRVAELGRRLEQAATKAAETESQWRAVCEHSDVLAADLEQAKGRIGAMEEEIERSNALHQRLLSDRDKLAEELKVAEHQTKALAAESDQATALQAMLEKVQNDARSHIETLTAEREGLMKSVEEQKSTITALRSGMEQERSDHQSRLEALAQERDELARKAGQDAEVFASRHLQHEADARSWEEESARLMRELEVMSGRAIEVERVLGLRQHDVQALSGDRDALRAQVDDAEKRIAELTRQLEQAATKAAETESQWRAVCEHSDVLAADLEQAKGRMAAMKEEIDKGDTLRTQLVHDRDDLAGKLRAAENEVRALSESGDQANALQQMLESVRNDAHSRIEALAAERDGLIESVEEQRSTATALRSGMEKERNEAQSRIEALTQERDDLARRVVQDAEALSGDKDALKAQVDDAEKRIAELRRRLEQAATKAAETESQWRAVCEHSDVLAADLEQAKGRMAAMKEEIDQGDALRTQLVHEREDLAGKLRAAENAKEEADAKAAERGEELANKDGEGAAVIAKFKSLLQKYRALQEYCKELEGRDQGKEADRAAAAAERVQVATRMVELEQQLKLANENLAELQLELNERSEIAEVERTSAVEALQEELSERASRVIELEAQLSQQLQQLDDVQADNVKLKAAADELWARAQKELDSLTAQMQEAVKNAKRQAARAAVMCVSRVHARTNHLSQVCFLRWISATLAAKVVACQKQIGGYEELVEQLSAKVEEAEAKEEEMSGATNPLLSAADVSIVVSCRVEDESGTTWCLLKYVPDRGDEEGEGDDDAGKVEWRTQEILDGWMAAALAGGVTVDLAPIPDTLQRQAETALAAAKEILNVELEEARAELQKSTEAFNVYRARAHTALKNTAASQQEAEARIAAVKAQLDTQKAKTRAAEELQKQADKESMERHAVLVRELERLQTILEGARMEAEEARMIDLKKLEYLKLEKKGTLQEMSTLSAELDELRSELEKAKKEVKQRGQLARKIIAEKDEEIRLLKCAPSPKANAETRDRRNSDGAGENSNADAGGSDNGLKSQSSFSMAPSNHSTPMSNNARKGADRAEMQILQMARMQAQRDEETGRLRTEIIGLQQEIDVQRTLVGEKAKLLAKQEQSIEELQRDMARAEELYGQYSQEKITYLKNVVKRFVACDKREREGLIPVIATILRFSEEELAETKAAFSSSKEQGWTLSPWLGGAGS